MVTVLAAVYYFWGFINALLILNSIGLGKAYVGLKTSNPVLFQKKTAGVLAIFVSSFLWSCLGLLSVQWAWFALYLLYVWTMQFVNKKFNWVDNPTLFNITFYRLQRLSYFVAIMFPVMNHFHFHINITQKIIELFF